MPETGEILRINNKHYKLSVSIGLSPEQMRPVLRVFDTGTVPRLIRANVPDQKWLDNIRKRNMPEMLSAFNTKLDVSETVTIHLYVG